MMHVKNVNSLTLIILGVNHVMFNISNKISKIGLVEILALMSLFEMYNSKLKIILKFWSGLIMIGLKMLNIWPMVILELFTKPFGKMDICNIGIILIING